MKDNDLFKEICKQDIPGESVVNWFGVVAGIAGAIAHEVPGLDIILGIVDEVQVNTVFPRIVSALVRKLFKFSLHKGKLNEETI